LGKREKGVISLFLNILKSLLMLQTIPRAHKIKIKDLALSLKLAGHARAFGGAVFDSLSLLLEV